MSSRIYLIPHWVEESLRRHGLETSTVLDFPKARTVLSMNDLLTIEVLQSLGEKVIGGNDVVSSSILYEWSITSLSDEDKKVLELQLTPLAADQEQKDLVCERLFSEGDSSEYKQAYKVVALDDKAIGVVVYPGFFTDTKRQEHHFSVIRDILKQLYVYEEHSSVAATPLTLRYIEHLSSPVAR